MAIAVAPGSSASARLVPTSRCAFRNAAGAHRSIDTPLAQFHQGLSPKGTKNPTDMCEVPVRRQDFGDAEFHHDRHRRKIGKRYGWLVRELFPQFDCPGESGPGDFLYVNKG